MLIGYYCMLEIGISIMIELHRIQAYRLVVLCGCPRITDLKGTPVTT